MQPQQTGLQQQQGSQVGSEQTGPSTQQDPSEPGWQDTGSEDFMDAWSDDVDDDDEPEGYAADHATGGQGHEQLMQLQPEAQQQLQNHLQQGQEQQQLHGQQQHAEDQVQQQQQQTQQQQQQQQQQHQHGAQPQELEMQTQEDQQGQQQQQQQHQGEPVDAILRLPAQELQQFLLQLDEQGFDIADIDAGSEASSSGGGSSDGSPDQETDEPADTGCTQFDPNVAASHQYLGDVDELEGSYGRLTEGSTARLPLLVLDGVVLFPGCQLPLLLNTPHELHLLDRALAAPPPFTRLLAVLPGPRSVLHSLPRQVCCTAEVRQMRRQGDDERSMAVLALGRQRAEVVAAGRNCAQSQVSVNVRILPEGCTTDVPPLMRQGFSAVHPALTRPWDLQLLVTRVRQLMELVLLPAASFQGTPLELSYWVSHNLPLHPSTRQLLLMCSCPAERLRLLLELLQRLDRLCCSCCGTQLATTAEVLAMNTEGIGGTYVNSHGYVHEMVTFSKVHGMRLYGGPETAHSWFPGYSWTIAHCGTCGQHMGWRFAATRTGLMPRAFWGIRRPGLLCATAPTRSSDGSEQDDAQGGVGEQAAGVPHEQNWMDLLLRGVRRGRLVLHLRPQPPAEAGAGGDD